MTTRLGSDGSESNVVGTFWARLQAEDWTGASALLAEGFVAEWPATRERITGKDDFIRIQREYPKPWGPIKVLRLVGTDGLVVAEVSVPGAQVEYRCSGFYECREGSILRATEYWITVGGTDPPPG
jgi:ketosteroid isomerase-like protein